MGFKANYRCLKKKIDRSSIVEILNRKGVNSFLPAYGLTPPGQIGYWFPSARDRTSKCEISFNDKTSIKTGPIPIIYLMESSPPHVNSVIESTLNALGFDVKMVPVPRSDFVDKIFSRDYHLALFSYGIPRIPELNVIGLYSSDKSIPLVPDEQLLPFEEVVDLIKDDLTAYRIAAIEEQMWKTSDYIPLVFERAAYLISSCIELPHYNQFSPIINFIDIRLRQSCLKKN